MRLLTNLLLLSMLIAIAIGCSSGSGTSPVTPKNDNVPFENVPFVNETDLSGVLDTPPSIDIPRADCSPLAEGDVKEDPSGILYAGTLELDAEKGTITNT
ncbi:hypothetical protein J7L05_07035, partial [bacterium]|nr:hypothetical protein [bacterium]